MTGAPMLWLPARAKLNLWLRIVGRRADGYHLLSTLFHAVALHDDVGIALAPSGIALTVTADVPADRVPATPDNLVVRALREFASATGYLGGFTAALHKRI
ncbi:MAG: 4-(cytidine 5'-diphospho)-2-C-methyl-D-erythritol kinase, partial [Planctomycetota bacterium]